MLLGKSWQPHPAEVLHSGCPTGRPVIPPLPYSACPATPCLELPEVILKPHPQTSGWGGLGTASAEPAHLACLMWLP